MNRILMGMAAALLVASCGGGGKSTPPLAPLLNWAPQSVKSFYFTWADVAGEKQYRLLEDPDSASGYTQIATIAADATSYTLPGVALYQRVNARYILQACNSGGCTDSAPVFVAGNLAAAVGYVKTSNPDISDAFGNAISLSADGQTLAVGAPGEDSNATGVNGNQADNSAAFSGAVYVFARSGGSWSQQAYLKASNSGANDQFGQKVTLSADGQTLAVTASQEDSNATGVGGNQADNSALESGAVYVFTRSGGSWSQQAYVKASNTGAGDLFGYSLALSDDGQTLAVGAWQEDSNATGVDGNQADNSAATSGAAYVFTRSGGSWSQQAYLKASNTGTGDGFGALSVALSADGSTLAVGAISEASNAVGINGNQTDNTANGSGAVYVFVRSGVSWSQQAYVKASNSAAADQFGFNVALSDDGSTLAVGAAHEDSNATGVYGDQADNSASGSGAVYVFVRSGASWSQQAYVKATNSAANEFFGYSLALSADGHTLAVAAPTEASNATGVNGDMADNSTVNSGAAYVFTRSGGTWMSHAYVKASNTGASDQFGYSLALSADGQTLAVAANAEDSNATGVNGNQADNSASGSGAVYLY